ncbi:hypothetical protein L7F22_051190 [Adiantum nelumboides]|nr:hypothetical protein [Adiantum nelumboides]
MLAAAAAALLGFSHGLYSTGGVDKEAESAWAAAFPHLPIPASVLLEESPLTSAEASSWAKRLSGNNHAYGASVLIRPGWAANLCTQGRLMCSRELRLSFGVPKTLGFDAFYFCDPPYMAARYVEPGHFFRLHGMFVGASMAFPNLNHPVPSRPYLPHVVAQRLSLKPHALSGLLAAFGIPKGTPMAAAMRDTITRCNTASSTSDNSSMACVTSIEDMLRFVKNTLGGSVDFLESDASPNYLLTSLNSSSSTINITITSLEQRTRLKDSNVVCHKRMFPSMVRVCHELQSTKVYMAEMKLLMEQYYPKYIDAVAICHFDTSAWDPNHPSFLLLGISPGQGEVCHWVRADEHVWVDA